MYINAEQTKIGPTFTKKNFSINDLFRKSYKQDDLLIKILSWLKENE